MYYMLNFLLLIGVFGITSCENGFLPSYIQPCNFKDVNFAKCVSKQMEISLPHFTKGIPELGVPSIDPITLDDIKIDGNGLKLGFTEAQLYGLSKSQLVDLNVDLKEEKFVLAFKGNVTLIAKYSIDGRILILPIKGQGNAKVKAQNLDVTISSKLLHFNDSHGNDHFKLISPTYNYNIGVTKFEFRNLFNGNKQLADATHSFANDNWKQIMDDLAPPVVKQIVKTGIKAINKFFAGVTVQQIIQEYNN